MDGAGRCLTLLFLFYYYFIILYYLYYFDYDVMEKIDEFRCLWILFIAIKRRGKIFNVEDSIRLIHSFTVSTLIPSRGKNGPRKSVHRSCLEQTSIATHFFIANFQSSIFCLTVSNRTIDSVSSCTSSILLLFCLLSSSNNRTTHQNNCFGFQFY
jgi:hypothetical protein